MHFTAKIEHLCLFHRKDVMIAWETAKHEMTDGPGNEPIDHLDEG